MILLNLTVSAAKSKASGSSKISVGGIIYVSFVVEHPQTIPPSGRIFPYQFSSRQVSHVYRKLLLVVLAVIYRFMTTGSLIPTISMAEEILQASVFDVFPQTFPAPLESWSRPFSKEYPRSWSICFASLLPVFKTFTVLLLFPWMYSTGVLLLVSHI